MQKDITEKRLENWNDVFVDIFNNLVFDGKKVLAEEHLVPLPTESFSRNQDGTIRQGSRDIRKADQRNGRYRLICGDENQQGIDNTMPQRVTAVLYWGNEEWKKPRTLHDMLEFPSDMEEEIKPYVADYPINLIQLAKLPEEVRSRLTSDFRLVAEYAANHGEPEKLWKVMRDQGQTIRHPEEFLDVMSEVASDKRFKEIKERMGEEKKEELSMYSMWDDVEKEGKLKCLTEIVCKKLRKGKPLDVIVEALEEEPDIIREICKVAEAYAPEYDYEKVYGAWNPLNH